MIGIVVALLISALLLKLVGNHKMAVLGFNPTKARCTQFAVGFLLVASICGLYNVATVAFVANSWVLNPNLQASALLSGILWVVQSVLFEELVFRGALLYLAVIKFGERIACLISACCFGVYHWFSYGLLGNLVQMAVVFAMTGLVGFVLAWAFVKTKSLYLAIAFHLGWNLVTIVVFSNGPIGEQILIQANGVKADGMLSLWIFLFQVFAFPVGAMVCVRWTSVGFGRGV